ncbi:DUF6314 family protein [Tropicimonas aquimaris]|uniref:DUF6314 family protein n=1 Tax=Tropicimonas aquimaris TaxID=914152 RepID=A0ABW3IQ24_9RHOB
MDEVKAPQLEDFAGLWRLERRIDDHRAGVVMRLDGEARFTPRDAGLDYSETGTLIAPGAPPLQATRRYRWMAQGSDIEVFFEDGRPFHAFRPGGAPSASHWCDPDSYRVAYDFSAWPAWSSRWSVDGPRKNYTMQSWYHPT